MPSNPQQIVSLLIAAAAFGLVLSVWLVLVLLWSMKRRQKSSQVEQRLKLVRPELHDAGAGRILRLWHDGKEATTVVPGLANDNGLIVRLERMRVDAGSEAPLTSTFFGLLAAMVISGLGAWLFTSSLMAAAALPVAVLLGFYIYVTYRISSRRNIFERQLIDALDLAARSLRVGHPLVGSFRMISEELPAPVGELFGEVCQQQQLGVSMDQALRDIARRSDSDDLKFFATCVVIQLGSGGNLADMMERLANVIRERNRLARRVRVLTAQTQFSKRILLALPFFIFVLLAVLNPTYMKPLYTTFAGDVLIVVSGIGLLLGWLTMNWLSKLTP
jgi:tight adherence protein B